MLTTLLTICENLANEKCYLLIWSMQSSKKVCSTLSKQFKCHVRKTKSSIINVPILYHIRLIIRVYILVKLKVLNYFPCLFRYQYFFIFIYTSCQLLLNLDVVPRLERNPFNLVQQLASLGVFWRPKKNRHPLLHLMLLS